MGEIRIGSSFQSGSLQKGQVERSRSGNFEDILNDAMNKINQVQRDAELAIRELASGGDMTQAMISIEKADLSFQMMVEIRNRLLNAYEEIMRMQV